MNSEHQQSKEIAKTKKNGGKGEKKTSGNNADSTSVEFSLNLVKVLERRYPLAPSDAKPEDKGEEDTLADAQQLAKSLDIWPNIEEYLRLCLSCGNHAANTKYCLLYILKTHKMYFEEFKKLQQAKGMEDFCEIIFSTKGNKDECEHALEGISEEARDEFTGQYYKKRKELIPAFSLEQEAFL